MILWLIELSFMVGMPDGRHPITGFDASIVTVTAKITLMHLAKIAGGFFFFFLTNAKLLAVSIGIRFTPQTNK